MKTDRAKLSPLKWLIAVLILVAGAGCGGSGDDVANQVPPQRFVNQLTFTLPPGLSQGLLVMRGQGQTLSIATTGQQDTFPSPIVRELVPPGSYTLEIWPFQSEFGYTKQIVTVNDQVTNLEQLAVDALTGEPRLPTFTVSSTPASGVVGDTVTVTVDFAGTPNFNAGTLTIAPGEGTQLAQAANVFQEREIMQNFSGVETFSVTIDESFQPGSKFFSVVFRDSVSGGCTSPETGFTVERRE